MSTLADRLALDSDVSDPHGFATAPSAPVRTLKLTKASEITPRRQRWLWTDRIPVEVVTLFAGKGGVGKSTYALHVAALASRGELPGEWEGEEVTTLIVSHEDAWDTQMVPRLMAAGADLDRIVHLEIDVDGYESLPIVELDRGRLKAAVEQTGARIVLVDPLTSIMGGDSNKLSDVRAALNPLDKFAKDNGVAVLGIAHLNKGQGDMSSRLSGSHAIRDVARSVLVFAADDDSGEVVVSTDKGNYSKHAASFAYELLDTPVEVTDGTTWVARVIDKGETDRSAADLLQSSGDAVERNAAQSFILTYLEERGGSAAASEIIDAARGEFTEAQLKDARRRCRDPRIESRKNGYQGGWEWALIDAAPPLDPDSLHHLLDGSPFDPSSELDKLTIPSCKDI